MRSIYISKPWLFLLLSLSIALFGAYLSTYSGNELFHYGIAADVLLTGPLLFYFLSKNYQYRKVVSLALGFLGLAIIYFLLPSQVFNGIKSKAVIIIPLIELGFFTFTIYRLSSFLRKVDWREDDVYLAVRTAMNNAFDNKTIAAVFTSEICMIYYSLFAWKKPVYNSNQYPYGHSGSKVIYFALSFVLVIETVALHFLLVKWSPVLAYIFLAISVYSFIQLLAHTKAMSRRPIELKNDILTLKSGLGGNFVIPVEAIKGISKDSLTEEDSENRVAKLGLLGGLESHNAKIELKNILVFEKIYGIKAEAKTILFFVDKPDELIELIEKQLK